MAHGWEGKLTRLVPVDPAKHTENAFRWLNDPETTQNLMVGDFPLSRLAEENYLREAATGKEHEIAFAIETQDGRHIGFSGIHRIDWRSGFGTTGTIIGDGEDWGKGYGTDAAVTRAHYCFEVLGLRILYSSFIEPNVRSASMQHKVGYQVSGRFPKRHWKRGGYRDEVLTYLPMERFRELHGAVFATM
jgi:RimJ/RimL family protein N-acetyltransferase